MISLTACQSSQKEGKEKDTSSDSIRMKMLEKAEQQLRDSIKPDTTRTGGRIKKDLSLIHI